MSENSLFVSWSVPVAPRRIPRRTTSDESRRRAPAASAITMRPRWARSRRNRPSSSPPAYQARVIGLRRAGTVADVRAADESVLGFRKCVCPGCPTVEIDVWGGL